MDGKIFELLGLIRDHRGAVEYDFRTRLGTPLTQVGQTMTLTEAGRQAHILATDSTSQTFVALNGWKYPAGPEFFLLADLFDAYAVVNFKRPKPYPRPQPEVEKNTEKFGEVIRPESLADVLRAFGREVPTQAPSD